MAEEGIKLKKALERYNAHKLQIKNLTSLIPKGSESEKVARIKRAREDYAYFVKSYFPHIATSECGSFQRDAANHIKDNDITYDTTVAKMPGKTRSDNNGSCVEKP